jgi:hypothetical protein
MKRLKLDFLAVTSRREYLRLWCPLGIVFSCPDKEFSDCPDNEPRVNLNYSAHSFRRVSAHCGARFLCFSMWERWWRVSWESG